MGVCENRKANECQFSVNAYGVYCCALCVLPCARVKNCPIGRDEPPADMRKGGRTDEP